MFFAGAKACCVHSFEAGMKTLFVLAAAATTAAAQARFVEGNPASPVRVIIYEDLECPDCAAFRVMMDETLLPKFQSSVAFEHRDFPLNKHAWARKAAIASRYFEIVSPSLALEFRRTTMAHLTEIPKDKFEEHLQAFCVAHGVDPAKAVAALTDPALGAAVEKDYEEGVARGVAHTPTIFVDGEPFIEHFPVEDVVQAIERELGAGKR